MQHDGFHDLQQ